MHKFFQWPGGRFAVAFGVFALLLGVGAREWVALVSFVLGSLLAFVPGFLRASVHGSRLPVATSLVRFPLVLLGLTLARTDAPEEPGGWLTLLLALPLIAQGGMGATLLFLERTAWGMFWIICGDLGLYVFIKRTETAGLWEKHDESRRPSSPPPPPRGGVHHDVERFRLRPRRGPLLASAGTSRSRWARPSPSPPIALRRQRRDTAAAPPEGNTLWMSNADGTRFKYALGAPRPAARKASSSAPVARGFRGWFATRSPSVRDQEGLISTRHLRPGRVDFE